MPQVYELSTSTSAVSMEYFKMHKGFSVLCNQDLMHKGLLLDVVLLYFKGMVINH